MVSVEQPETFSRNRVYECGRMYRLFLKHDNEKIFKLIQLYETQRVLLNFSIKLEEKNKRDALNDIYYGLF